MEFCLQTQEGLGIASPFPCPAPSSQTSSLSPCAKHWVEKLGCRKLIPYSPNTRDGSNYSGVLSLTPRGYKQGHGDWGPAVTPSVPLRMETHQLCSSRLVWPFIQGCLTLPPHTHTKKALLGPLTLFPSQVFILARGNGTGHTV